MTSNVFPKGRQHSAHPRAAVLLAALLLSLQGCATVAVTGAAQGISYTFTHIAYRTFTFPREKVRVAAQQALRKMGIAYIDEEHKGDLIILNAKTAHLTISVRLTTITGKATKIAVNAHKNYIFKDKAVAVEIITQTGRALGLPY